MLRNIFQGFILGVAVIALGVPTLAQTSDCGCGAPTAYAQPYDSGCGCSGALDGCGQGCRLIDSCGCNTQAGPRGCGLGGCGLGKGLMNCISNMNSRFGSGCGISGRRGCGGGGGCGIGGGGCGSPCDSGCGGGYGGTGGCGCGGGGDCGCGVGVGVGGGCGASPCGGGGCGSGRGLQLLNKVGCVSGMITGLGFSLDRGSNAGGCNCGSPNCGGSNGRTISIGGGGGCGISSLLGGGLFGGSNDCGRFWKLMGGTNDMQSDAALDAAGMPVLGNDFNDGFAIGFGRGRWLDNNTSFEIDTIWRNNSGDLTAAVPMDGRINNFSTTFNLFRHFGSSDIRPYVGGGIGLGRQDGEFLYNGANAEISDFAFAYQAAVGVSYQVRCDKSWFLEYRYYANTDTDVEVGGVDVGEFQYESNSVLFGFRENF